MQATIASFDAASRGGTILLDDGIVMAFKGVALTGSGLRLLRLGQRVRLEVSGQGSEMRVERLQILTMS